MVLHNPLPSGPASEYRKAAKILTSFVDPRQAFGPDKVIPPEILQRAKGLAILTVFKAGFVGSLRAGSGVVVARLEDGSWSAPSSITMGGLGMGSQIGIELTDFVFILNDAAAVRTFATKGTLGVSGNVSIAAGPVGRNAEAAGAVSAKGVAAIFSYSKTQGLFAGISLEGMFMATRGDANARAYQRRGVQPAELLDGSVPPPPAADPLMRILQSRVFTNTSSNSARTMYNDVPIYDDRHDDVIWEGRRGNGLGEGQAQHQSRRKTWADDPSLDRPSTGLSNVSAPARAATFAGAGVPSQRTGVTDMNKDEYIYRDRAPSRPTAPKPVFSRNSVALGPNQARAKFTFEADQPGDLPFRKGDIITIVKRTESSNDWWTGRIGEKEGIFPSNYVEVG
ncbi:MAG: Light-sensor Protein kinase [Watsoniomyces obsoletus]|nr:MAG: Light-sensor Protein kinase [Watsoniomyces obsoletus]